MTDAERRIRPARDDDAEGLIALIGAIFAEYPHCYLDVDGEMPELRTIATSFALLSGKFWVGERGGRIVACVGWSPAGERRIELRKLYVAASERRQGLGAALCELIEGEARRLRATHVELWSDTRFHDAHRLYEKRGYTRGAETRELHDISDTVEYSYELTLG